MSHLCTKFTTISFVQNQCLKVINEIHLEDAIQDALQSSLKKTGVIVHIPVQVLLTRPKS